MDEKFARYLIGELRWELAQFDVATPDLRSVDDEQIEVLSFSGGNFMRVRVSSAVFDIHLSWRGDVSPTIKRVPEAD